MPRQQQVTRLRGRPRNVLHSIVAHRHRYRHIETQAQTQGHRHRHRDIDIVHAILQDREQDREQDIVAHAHAQIVDTASPNSNSRHAENRTPRGVAIARCAQWAPQARTLDLSYVRLEVMPHSAVSGNGLVLLATSGYKRINKAQILRAEAFPVYE